MNQPRQQQVSEAWFGYAAHLCVRNKCLFHMVTVVGEKYLISTIGHYNDPMEAIGSGKTDFFETYVFEYSGINPECRCCPTYKGSEISGVRRATARDAQDCHRKTIEKYKAKCLKETGK